MNVELVVHKFMVLQLTISFGFAYKQITIIDFAYRGVICGSLLL